MLFNKHHNGVPLACVISSRNTTYDIKKWLVALFAMGMKHCPEWNVKAFITEDDVAEIHALRCHVCSFQKKHEKDISFTIYSILMSYHSSV